MWKVLSQGIHMCNMKALSLPVWKLWPRLKFFKSRSNFKVKVTRTKLMVLSWGIHIWNMKALSLLVWKLCPKLKFLSTQPTPTWTVGLWHYSSPDIHPGSLKRKRSDSVIWQKINTSRSNFKVKVKSKNFGGNKKVLLQGIHMWNMKANLFFKFWPRLKFCLLKRWGHRP